MSDQPLVSVIVPVYNAAAHLERCVESIINQTYRNIELILIDDGSTDGSGEICDFFEKRDRRIRAIRCPNGGVSRARNLGIKASRGEFIQYVDADDYVDVGMSALLVGAQRAVNADLVITGYIEIDVASGRQRSFGLEERRIMSHEQLVASFTMLRKAELVNSCWNKLYRASILSSTGIEFAEGIDLAEDALFNLSYMGKSRCVAISDAKPYFYMRYPSGNNLTGRFHASVYEIARSELQAIRRLYEGAGADPSGQERDYAFRVATQLAPYFAKHLGKRDYKSYIRLAAEMRNDDYYLEHHAVLRAVGARNRVLLLLFYFSRFEVLYFLGLLSRLKRLMRRSLESVKGVQKKWAKWASSRWLGTPTSETGCRTMRSRS